MSSKEDRITADFVRELFHYDPDTGVFTRRVTRQGMRGKAGNVAGTRKPNGYLSISICGANYMAHRLAWLYVHGAWPAGHIDHINQDKGDNRIANLRDASHTLNMHNRTVNRNNKTGLRGVGIYKDSGRNRKRFRAYIGKEGKTLHLGSYATAEEAHAAYCKAAAELHPYNPAALKAGA